MEKILITGGVPLKGEVDITGAKNAALGILPACILADGVSIIDNLPDIQDIKNYYVILEKLGAVLTRTGDGLAIDPQGISRDNIPLIEEECTCMRASYYLLGTLLSKFGDVTIPLPGGCDIGARPIDLHIKGFEALGAAVEMRGGYIHVFADRLRGAEIYFDTVSVGATINVMLAAVKAEGLTVIENAAKEPHVVDIANFLNLMGAKIMGAGTDTVKIKGVEKLEGRSYSVVPDQISAGTYMIAAAATCGDVLVKNVIPEHLDSVSTKLREMGHTVIELDDSVRVIGHTPMAPIAIKTMPHPGFPTDLQQPMGVLMCLADGVSSITEKIFENRFKYVNEIKKMGADIIVNGSVAIVNGVGKLYASKIRATDLRAGAAMIIAGLVAEGTTEVYELQHIDRGYDNIVNRLKLLGADIVRTND